MAPAQRPAAAEAKASIKRTEEGLPVHSFRMLINEGGTLTANTRRVAEGCSTFTLHTRPTAVHQRCFELVGIEPRT